VEYAYDVDGIRVQKTEGGTNLTKYLIDKNQPFAQVLEERDNSGSLIVSYVYGDDLISQNRSGILSFYHYDGQMSTRQLTDATEVVTDSYVYDAFGVLINRVGTTVNNYLYTGEQYDPNIGFYYLRARYYNSALGRFITSDLYPGSIYEPISLHKYVYANLDPIDKIDPTGLFGFVEMMVVATIIGILASITAGVVTYARGGTATEIWKAQAKWFGYGFVGAFVLYGAVWGVSVLTTWIFANLQIVTGLTYTGTTAAHQLDPLRRVPYQILEAAIRYGNRILDPQGAANAYKYTIEMFRNGKLYELEVVAQVVSPGVYRILHFLYH